MKPQNIEEEVLYQFVDDISKEWIQQLEKYRRKRNIDKTIHEKIDSNKRSIIPITIKCGAHIFKILIKNSNLK